VALATVLALTGAGAVRAAGSATGAALPRGGTVVARIPIPAGYGGIAVGERAVWAVSDRVSALTRIDPRGNFVAARITVKPVKPCPEFVCGEPAAGHGSLWLPRASDDTVWRVGTKTNAVVTKIRVGRQPTAAAVTSDAVWVANSRGPTVSRIDPATNRVVATVRLGPARAASDRLSLAVGEGAVWATVPELGAVVRIDPTTNRVSDTIKLSFITAGEPCGHIAADRDGVWASSAHCPNASNASVVTRIDPRMRRVEGTVTGFRVAIGLGLGFGSLWVADIERKTIDRVDPGTGRIVARLPVGGIPIRIGIGFGSVWVRDDSGRVLRITPQP
jgi:DNA-binding beta-propeller fold protein YncE